MNGNGKVNGFTLVEIAIVLVVVGLLLGGILKGQEMIQNARVRSIVEQQTSLRLAWNSFVQRFGVMPGDFAQASIHVVDGVDGNGDGLVSPNESPAAFRNMVSAGFLRCQGCAATQLEPPSADNSLVNHYGGVVTIWSDNAHWAFRGTPSKDVRLLIHTGPRIPSDVIGELDRKIDDGVPNMGDFRFNDYDPLSNTGFFNAEDCMTLEDGTGIALKQPLVGYWRTADASPHIYSNCGGSLFL